MSCQLCKVWFLFFYNVLFPQSQFYPQVRFHNGDVIVCCGSSSPRLVHYKITGRRTFIELNHLNKDACRCLRLCIFRWLCYWWLVHKHKLSYCAHNYMVQYCLHGLVQTCANVGCVLEGYETCSNTTFRSAFNQVDNILFWGIVWID